MRTLVVGKYNGTPLPAKDELYELSLKDCEYWQKFVDSDKTEFLNGGSCCCWALSIFGVFLTKNSEELQEILAKAPLSIYRTHDFQPMISFEHRARVVNDCINGDLDIKAGDFDKAKKEKKVVSLTA